MLMLYACLQVVDILIYKGREELEVGRPCAKPGQ